MINVTKVSNAVNLLFSSSRSLGPRTTEKLRERGSDSSRNAKSSSATVPLPRLSCWTNGVDSVNVMVLEGDRGWACKIGGREGGKRG